MSSTRRKIRTQSVGSKGIAVADAKRRLFAIGHMVEEDDVFDKQLERAIFTFQRSKNLPATGELDDDTYGAILSATRKLIPVPAEKES